MKTALTAISLAALLVAPAYAHPDKPVETEDTEVFQWDGEQMKDAARELEEALSDTEVFSEMADLFATFASSVEVRRDREDGTALLFDGEELLSMKRDTRRDSDGSTGHRVRIGPFFDPSRLTEAKKRLRGGNVPYDIIRVTG